MHYSGNIIRAQLPGNSAANASGNWQLEDAVQSIGEGKWPSTITQGDPYFASNVLLLSGDNTQGASNSVFNNTSQTTLTTTRQGNSTQGSFTPFNGLNYSVYFDGSGDYISAPDLAIRELGSNNFTMECWVYFTGSGAGVLFSHRTNATTLGPMVLLKNASNQILFYAATSTTAWNIFNGTVVGTVNLFTWYHISICRSGNNFYGSINGNVTLLGTSSSAIGDSTAPWYLGGDSNGNTMSGNMSSARLVIGSALYTAGFVPSTLPLSPITGTVLLACQSCFFQDRSPINSTLTPAGNSAVVEFSPFEPTTCAPTSYSVQFDGTGDYLSSTLAVGAADFTVECWVYLTSTLNNQCFVDFRASSTATAGFFFGLNAAGKIQVYNNANIIEVTANIPLGYWNHIALVRSGTDVTVYVNGVSVGTGTSSTNFTDNNFRIGSSVAAAQNLIGSMSNLRITNTAVYTANFTPPTAPLTAISGTSLLTCNTSALVDSSSNSLAITSFGEACPISANPFGETVAFSYGYSSTSGGTSGYFDGTGDYLDIAWNAALTLSANDFYMECWVYPLTTGTAVGFMSNWQSGGQFQFTRSTANRLVWSTQSQGGVTGTTRLIYPYCWNHIAAIRKNGVIAVYVNGVKDATTLAIGTTGITGTGKVYRIAAGGDATAQFPGYVAGVKINITNDVPSANNFYPPVAPPAADGGTALLYNMADGGIFDWASGTIFETLGNVQVDTGNKKFGTGSIYFDGTGDYLSARASPLWQLGGDFTIELWVKFTAHGSTGGLVGSANSSTASAITAGWFLDFSGTTDKIQFEAQGGVALVSTDSVTVNEWTHVAAVRNSGVITLYINGTPNGSVSSSTVFWSSGSPLLVGVDRASSSTLTGWIDDLRISRIARYTAAFSPSGPFPTY